MTEKKNPLAPGPQDLEFAGKVMTRVSVVEDKDERRTTLQLLVEMAHAHRVLPMVESEFHSVKGSLQYNRVFNWIQLAFIAFLLLSGCAQAPQEQATAPIKNATPKPDRRFVSFHTSNILIDQDTGCQYLTLYSHGITPRMQWARRRSDGSRYETQVGCKEQ